jgi:hypothetical protein
MQTQPKFRIEMRRRGRYADSSRVHLARILAVIQVSKQFFINICCEKSASRLK